MFQNTSLFIATSIFFIEHLVFQRRSNSGADQVAVIDWKSDPGVAENPGLTEDFCAIILQAVITTEQGARCIARALAAFFTSPFTRQNSRRQGHPSPLATVVADRHARALLLRLLVARSHARKVRAPWPRLNRRRAERDREPSRAGCEACSKLRPRFPEQKSGAHAVPRLVCGRQQQRGCILHSQPGMG